MITRNTDYSIQRLRGLSTDTKPTDVPNGSEFREMDTGKKFLYSAAGTEWIEQQGSGGGSGGGVFFVTDNNNTLDKTWAEISAASENSVVVLKLENKLGYLMDSCHVENAYGCAFIRAGTDLHDSLVVRFHSYATSDENGYPVHE